MARLFRPSSPAGWCFLALMLFVLTRGVSGPFRLHGDGLEYVVQTQSIALHRELRVDMPRIVDYWRRSNPLGIAPGPILRDAEGGKMQSGFGGLYRDRFGDYRYYHFWGYSLAVAPLYALLRVLKPGSGLEYFSFRIFNLMCLMLPLLLAWRRRPGWPLLGITALTVATPLFPYVDWQHTELYCLGLILLAFHLAGSGRRRWLAPIPLGLAAAQNAPIGLFFPLHLAYLLSRGRPGPGEGRRISLGYGLGAAAAMVPLIYFKHYFGTWSLIAGVGQASLRYATLSRAADLFINPLAGAVWFFPVIFLFLPASVSRRNALLIGLAAASTLAVSWLSGATVNFNSSQVGAFRYAVWTLGPLLFLVLDADWGPSLPRGSRRLLYLAAAVGCLLLVAYFRTGEFFLKRASRFVDRPRTVPEVARLVRWFPWLGDAEVLVESIRRKELLVPWDFNGIYLWDLGKDRSLWVVSRTALGIMRQFAWAADALPEYRTIPPNKGLFAFRKGKVRLVGLRATAFKQHPRYGGYLIVRMKAGAPRPKTNVPVYRAP